MKLLHLFVGCGVGRSLVGDFFPHLLARFLRDSGVAGFLRLLECSGARGVIVLVAQRAVDVGDKEGNRGRADGRPDPRGEEEFEESRDDLRQD